MGEFFLFFATAVIYVGYEDADGEEELRQFFLYPGPHDKVTLTACFRVEARTHQGRAGLVGLGPPAPGRLSDWPRSVRGAPLTGRRGVRRGGVHRRPGQQRFGSGACVRDASLGARLPVFIRPARQRGKMCTAISWTHRRLLHRCRDTTSDRLVRALAHESPAAWFVS